MDSNERLARVEAKQESFEDYVKLHISKNDENINHLRAEQAEWRQRHDEEMKEYREDMKSLKKHIDNLIGNFAIGLLAVLIAFFALFYSVISNNFVSKADYQNDQQRAFNQSKTTTVLSPP